MSLSKIKFCKTITGRKKILSDFLKGKEPGELSDTDDNLLKYLFITYYTTDEGQTKYSEDDIDRFYIGYGSYNTICFHIRLKNGKTDVATYKRLAGENRTNNANLNKAYRNAVSDQINEFKKNNPLNSGELCPIGHCVLGENAEVDHVVPLYKLIISWMNEGNYGPTCKYVENHDYVLDQPYLESWTKFHKQHAELRWLSYKGNRVAHSKEEHRSIHT